MTLSHLEQMLYDSLEGRGDVAIVALHRVLFGEPVLGMTNQAMQRRLGPTLGRLNAKLRASGEVVEPGELRRTYRLRKRRG